MAALTSELLSVALLSVGLLLSVSAEQRIITAEPGQDVTLTCGAPNNNIPIIVVKWSRADLEPEYALIYRDGQMFLEGQNPSFKNRVDLQDRQMKDGDVSLILKNVTTHDGGTYECRVFQEGTNRRKRAIDPIISIIELVVSASGKEDGRREGGGEKDGGEKEGGEKEGGEKGGGEKEGGEKDGGEKEGGEKDGGEDGNSRGHLGLVPGLSVGIIIPAAAVVAALWISKRHQKKKSAPPPDEAAVQQLV